MKKGKRPPELKSRKKRSRLLTRVEKGNFKNVIKVARQYEAYLSQTDIVSYKQVAEHFGITKASISQYLGILNRLPADFVTWLENCEDASLVAFFGKKRLNTIAKQPGENHKILLLSEAHTIPEQLDSVPDEYSELLAILEKSAPSPRGREHRAINLD